MIEVNVNVRLSASPELSALIAGMFAGAVNAAPVNAAPVEPEKKTRTRTAPAKEVEAATEAPEPAAEIAPAETAAPEPIEQEAMTEEALRAVVQAYSTQGKEQRENVKALLAKYGCSRIADIPAELRNEFKAYIEIL